MQSFVITEPNRDFYHVLRTLQQTGIQSPSRNGPVVRFPGPVCLEYVNPRRRLLTDPTRDANPFFHLFETMWMFGGLSELEPLLVYNKEMAQYSDDGKNLRGTAYGHRWRNYQAWGDQLHKAVDTLLVNPDDRRVVITMWDPMELGKKGKDFACNLQVLFSTRPPQDSGRYTLDMTVTNRSNDLIYGAMGSNMFHFSMLLEYVASHVKMDVGTYYQFSNNLHLYVENPVAARCWEMAESIPPDGVLSSPGSDDCLTRLPLPMDAEPIAEYVLDRDSKTKLDYVSRVVQPLVEGYQLYKLKSRTGLSIDPNTRITVAQQIVDVCESAPLRTACHEWLERKRRTVLVQEKVDESV